MASNTRSHPANLRLYWFYYGFVLFVFIQQGVMAQRLDTTADYPKGCHGGPGPAKGYDKRLVNIESAGVILQTNMAGHTGSMKIQIDVVAYLGYDDKKTRFWWKPSPGDKSFSPSDEGAVHVDMPAMFHASFTGGQKVDTDKYSISGSAVSNGMTLYGHAKQTSGSDLPLSVDFKISMERLKKGWKYLIGYGARGSYGTKGKQKTVYHYEVNVVKGILLG
ncbi:hypothetical protein FOL46_002231 [Perkinsus olseni]|uniref:Uncharacterized protein n=1 Tax=Perkinsus olseni TaxID=32597 RepID=A0A7J6MUL0_PEROL|nr:hypothetical protein FOL46_002231 [Perkinsus olseni]